MVWKRTCTLLAALAAGANFAHAGAAAPGTAGQVRPRIAVMDSTTARSATTGGASTTAAEVIDGLVNDGSVVGVVARSRAPAGR